LCKPLTAPARHPPLNSFEKLLGTPPLELLTEWGAAALVEDYEGARSLANAALPLLM